MKCFLYSFIDDFISEEKKNKYYKFILNINKKFPIQIIDIIMKCIPYNHMGIKSVNMQLSGQRNYIQIIRYFNHKCEYFKKFPNILIVLYNYPYDNIIGKIHAVNRLCKDNYTIEGNELCNVPIFDKKKNKKFIEKLTNFIL